MREMICEKLKELRKKYGYSQKELAKAIHINQNTYSLLESGKTKIDIERLIQIANFYEIPVAEFFTASPPAAG